MFDERFARQYRYEPPSEFPLTSPYSHIVHHLSGPTLIAKTQTSLNRSKSVVCAKQKNPNCYFHSAYRFATRTLAIEVDSLVRVSRRVEKNHFDNVLDNPCNASSKIGTQQSRITTNSPRDYDKMKEQRIPNSR